MKLGVVMDPIHKIQPKKDTSYAILLEGQRRGWTLHYMEPDQLFIHNGKAFGNAQTLRLHHSENLDYTLGEQITTPLSEFDVIFMRKDPPFDMEYIYLTYILEHAEKSGTCVINKPQSLRDANEKSFATYFPQCCPPTLISRNLQQLDTFIQQQDKVVLKPVDGMGGEGIFQSDKNDPNLKMLLKTMTQDGQKTIVAQTYLDVHTHGDKRIFLINGEPLSYCLTRKPSGTDFRANLIAGGRGEASELMPHDRWICEQIGPTLKAKGLMLVGIDVIGDFLTEINVTSPTGVRQVEAAFGVNICGQLLDEVQALIKHKG